MPSCSSAPGLFNASIFAACIQPLSTSYTVCEGLGFESGVNKRFREAPIFYSLFTLLIVAGGGVVLLPKFPLVKMILWSQVFNGVLLPFVLIFMILLVNKQRLMKKWTNIAAVQRRGLGERRHHDRPDPRAGAITIRDLRA